MQRVVELIRLIIILVGHYLYQLGLCPIDAGSYDLSVLLDGKKADDTDEGCDN